MIIKLLKTLRIAEQNNPNGRLYEAGDIVEVADKMGADLVAEEYAQEMSPGEAKKVAAPAPDQKEKPVTGDHAKGRGRKAKS